MRSINLAMTNCLENKYINIYIYIWKIYICFEGNVSKKGVSILIEMTGEWEFHYLFFFNDLFSNEMFCCFLFTFFFLESRLFTLKYKENSLETLD